MSSEEPALNMRMIPVKEAYPAGTLPQFEVIITNASQQPVRFCRYRLDYRLKAAMVVDGGKGGQDFELQPFVSQTWEPLNSSKDIVILGPGEQLRHRLTFKDDPIFGFLRRAKQPPVIPASNAVDGFPAGKYSFNTALSNQVGLYVGKDGVFDHRLEGRKVPDQWPGIEGCYLKLFETTTEVVFR
ncbi:MAG: hypothetical protein KC800_27960 [Candidatus Eremiobacteraeota bacterium]|nr:hypothetical protein [Candidatus Eremiobacteraeota bacterium]